ncbi:MAG: 2-succinyl-5-enolpyruvyl-6-hydroxy-3-cyclohexene-1-carboxylic-acid synthase [Oscillochloris sp.]|nr:2-succinyl-5-enolpyruvyl-6-hydroxy-3-cyclohexene-1-carboxylic-acid synthase [Oscillochloris sp.]
MPETDYLLTDWVATIVGGLVSAGVSDLVVSPGSRSTPLALAAARHPQAQLWMHYDERSAGFFALGLARARGRPVALICTSGTAAANYLPAVAEANLARVPLLLLTADRPHELRDNGAPQTIDQVGMYGSNTRWASDLPEPSAGLLPYLRALLARARAAAAGPPAGPVHLNCPFREPLLPERTRLAAFFATAPSVPQVWATRRSADPQSVEQVAEELQRARRGLIICGPHDDPKLAPAAARLAASLGWPLLADPISQARRGPHVSGLVIGGYDAFLRDERFAASQAPDLVLRLGAMPTAKPLLQFLTRHAQARQIIVDGGAGWREPTSLAALHLFADEIDFCEQAAAQLGSERTRGDWLATWIAAERATQAAIAAQLASHEQLSEPRVFAELDQLLPAGATLFAANSMPVRDLDTFLPPGTTPLRILANRGANGIDGLTSTALGLSAGGLGPAVFVTGDLSLYHDSNGLLAAKLHGLDLTIVLINNDGGGIFSFLPQASESDQFERLFGTPHGLDFCPLAEFYGAHYSLAEGWADFRQAVRAGIDGGGLHIVEIRTSRTRNVADHRAIWPAVFAALAEAGVV